MSTTERKKEHASKAGRKNTGEQDKDPKNMNTHEKEKAKKNLKKKR